LYHYNDVIFVRVEKVTTVDTKIKKNVCRRPKVMSVI